MKSALVVAAAMAVASPMSAHATVVLKPIAANNSYGDTMPAYNFDAVTPIPDGAYATRDARGGHLPEPATWAMMILGFFGLSFAVRRRGSRATRMPRVRFA